MISSPPDPFWDYSRALYGRPGVEACCLRLQNRRGADVNMLLLCFWLAARGHDAVGEDAVRDILARTAPWRDQVVVPLRTVRTRLKGQHGEAPAGLTAALHKSVLAAELDAERIAQLIMSAGFDEKTVTPLSPEDGAGRAVINLARYFGVAGLTSGPGETSDLGILLGAAFPGPSADAIAALISDALD
jgi:uncharacterized protein (TIGR02444 family)